MSNYEKKIIIDGGDALVKYLYVNYSKTAIKPKKGVHGKERKIIRKTFKNLIFRGDFLGIEFQHCKFKNCEFNGVWGFFFFLKDCKFWDCHFRNSRWSHLEFSWYNLEFEKCHFRNIELDEGAIANMWFTKCDFIGFGMRGINPMENVHFIDCDIDESDFESLQYYSKDDTIDATFPDVSFDNCKIYSTYFNSVDLRNSYFFDTMLFKTSFIDCILSVNTISQTRALKFESYASMDFQTLLKSPKLSKEVMRNFFGVPEIFNFREIVSDMIVPKIFSTVFISYSFKDAHFASRLNKSLNKQGVRTFIWEKDAKGGARLEEIMITGINAHDKLLFIASENSIRSKACQYELTTARKKQEQSWKNVFFPIYIDEYLFQVTKSDIRPIDSVAEYWENIEEIKRVNALNFVKYNSKTINYKEFDKAVYKIIEGLKIDK